MKYLFVVVTLLLLPVAINADVKFEKYNAATDGWLVEIEDIPLTHDTLREYLTIICDKVYRIECDSLMECLWFDKENIKHIEWTERCDTIFRYSQYREVWAPKIQVWLDSLQWQKLLRILE